MGESGILYEIATGRPVVLNPSQPTPPPPAPLPPPPTIPITSPALAPVFTPRPLLHSQTSRPGSVSFIPPHVLNSLHHPQSITPDFTPVPNGYPGGYSGSPTPGDSSRATPTFFAPPRQSGRVQIRAPTTKGVEGSTSDLSTKPPSQPTYTPSAPSHNGSVHPRLQYNLPESYYPGYYPPPPTAAPANIYSSQSAPGPAVSEDPYYGSYYQPQYAYGGRAEYGYGGEAAYSGYLQQDPTETQQTQGQQPPFQPMPQTQQPAYY